MSDSQTNFAANPSQSGQPPTLADFARQLEQNNVAALELEETSENLWKYTVVLEEPVDGAKTIEFLALDLNSQYSAVLNDRGIVPVYHKEKGRFSMLIVQIVPIILFLGVFWFFLIRQFQGSSGPRT